MVRSSRKIAKNEEITISYIDPTESFEEWQEALFTAYTFACQCQRCTRGYAEPGEILTGDPILDEPIRCAISQLHDLLNALANDALELDGVEATMREICNETSSGKHWPINLHPIPTLYSVLARRFEQEQQREKALQLWLKIVYVIDPLRYPERLNPHQVENLRSLCQLEGYVY